MSASAMDLSPRITKQELEIFARHESERTEDSNQGNLGDRDVTVGTSSSSSRPTDDANTRTDNLSNRKVHSISCCAKTTGWLKQAGVVALYVLAILVVIVLITSPLTAPALAAGLLTASVGKAFIIAGISAAANLAAFGTLLVFNKLKP